MKYKKCCTWLYNFAHKAWGATKEEIREECFKFIGRVMSSFEFPIKVDIESVMSQLVEGVFRAPIKILKDSIKNEE